MNNILQAIAVFFITLYCKTWRIKFVNNALFDRYSEERRPLVVILWHDQLLPLTFSHRGAHAGTLASKSKDGDFITRVLERWGFRVARGSSTRGGVQALKGAKKILDEGRALAITVDGPRGPRHSVKSGAIFIAKMANTPILPTFARFSRYIRFNSWDKFLLPLPFSKVEVIFTEPFTVSADTSAEAVEAERAALEKIMLERTLENTPDFI